MIPVRITRSVKMPDPVRLSRYKKSPELGPKILFFSGGSALSNTSQVLKDYTYNSIHIVTPFDSGGSSAKLRKAFEMPSIGDLRCRLMSLADENITGHPEVYQLFTYRFPHDKTNDELLQQLNSLILGKDPQVSDISNPMRRLIRNQLGYFRAAMPDDFDLRGASIGNLILAGGYLNNHQHLDPIIFLFSKLVSVLGTVRSVVNCNLHLGAELEDGNVIIGQHNLTGKEVKPLESPIKRLFLSENLDQYIPATTEIRKKNRKIIKKSELICYPPGSFYSSLLANLLPNGVNTAIAQSDCPKVYVPNLGQDPEQIDMTLDDLVLTLLKYLKTNNGEDHSVDKLLNFILLDENQSRYPSKLSTKLMKELGIQVISTRLVSKQSEPYYDPKLLVAALLSLT
ncbi:MAG: GAK system CofD-like protein [Gammaproteobacteria bacterium]|nr:MAG: GAK system CofD-like protein [Gammaproteobacteria bacterium]